MKLAFVGLGRMGSAMAANLLKDGYEVVVFNRSREKSEALKKAGAQAAGSVAEAVKNCEAALTMLADDGAVRSVVFEENGLASSLSAGAIHVSMSTISVALSKKLAQEHAAREQAYVSAPVFGRPDAAAARKLVVVAAGERGAVEKVRGVLDAMGRQTFAAGDEPWHANLIKLNGNFMIACMMEAFGEAYASIRKAGADHHLFYEIMTELFGSPVYKNYGGSIANEKFEPAMFALKLGLKDIRLGLEAADELNVPMPFASVLRDHFLAAVANGQGDMDWSSIARTTARLGGLQADNR